jgi:hypothetical protein
VADLYRATVEGAGIRAAEFSRGQRRIQNTIIQEFRRMGRQVEQTYRDHAPRDRGIVRERTQAFVYFGRASEPQVTVRTFARDPESRYAYVRVTRWGHRKLAIFPRHSKALKVHIAGHRNPHIFIFRPNVDSASPPTDWAADAGEAVEPIIDSVQTRLGREVVRGVLG